MLKKFMILLTSVVLCAVSPMLSIAEDEQEVEFTSGAVVEALQNSLTIEKHSNAEQIRFVINDYTEFENINTIDDISIEDAVFIDYVEEGGDSVAVNIYKSNSMIDKESLDELTEHFVEEIDYGQEE